MMNYDFSVFCYIRFFSGFIAIVVALIILKRKLAHGAIYLALFELAAAVWSVSDGFEAAALTSHLKFLWSQIAYLGITTSCVFFLLFALHFTDYKKYVNKKLILLLFLIPAVTIIIAFTNEHHHILWQRMEIDRETNFSVYYYGFYFWIHIIYEYTVLTSGILILILSTFKVYSSFKTNHWLLVIGTLLPFMASIIYVFKLSPILGFDFTPISFIFSGIIILISFYNFRMFDIAPFARKQVIDNLRVGILVTGSDDQIIDSNPVFDKISGITENQRNNHLIDILPIINVRIEDFTAENDYSTESGIEINGEKKVFEIKYHAVLDSKNQLVCKIFILNDITTRKMVLDAIAESNKQRKIELLEKEALIKDLNAYARSVAHDLKNPINSIVGFSEIIQKNIKNNNLNNALTMINVVKNESLKMAEIIDSLLKLSVIRKEEIELTPINHRLIIGEAIRRLKKIINESNAVIDVPDYLPCGLGNNQLIEEVWVNLISNAIKYGGNPPVITLEYEETSPSFCTFKIRDNGMGLSENSFGKIFDDFERLGREDIEGHGLGLPIVKRIIEKLGGEVNVKSSNIEGEGCVFSFTLKSCETNP